jgi:hypothetical protein
MCIPGKLLKIHFPPTLQGDAGFPVPSCTHSGKILGPNPAQNPGCSGRVQNGVVSVQTHRVSGNQLAWFFLQCPGTTEGWRPSKSPTPAWRDLRASSSRPALRSQDRQGLWVPLGGAQDLQFLANSGSKLS